MKKFEFIYGVQDKYNPIERKAIVESNDLLDAIQVFYSTCKDADVKRNKKTGEVTGRYSVKEIKA